MMKNILRVLVYGICAATLIFVGYKVGSAGIASVSPPRVMYSLDKKQNDLEIVRLIDSANQFAYFAVYTFTESDVADALIRARQRGVDVRGITDRDQAEISDEAAVLKKLARAGIAVETQKHQDGIMHMKLLVTDNAYAVGSYNWTWSATNVNDEVLEIGTDDAVREQYLAIVEKVLDANK